MVSKGDTVGCKCMRMGSKMSRAQWLHGNGKMLHGRQSMLHGQQGCPTVRNRRLLGYWLSSTWFVVI